MVQACTRITAGSHGSEGIAVREGKRSVAGKVGRGIRAPPCGTNATWQPFGLRGESCRTPEYRPHAGGASRVASAASRDLWLLILDWEPSPPNQPLQQTAAAILASRS